MTAHNKDDLIASDGAQGGTTALDEAHRVMLRELASSKNDIWASIEEQVQELEQILAQYNPIDVIGNILFANAVFDAETYKEYAHEGSDVYIEYVTLLLLTKPYDTYAARTLEPIPVGDIQQRMKTIFDAMRQFLIVKDIDAEQLGPPSSLMRLQARIVAESLLVRYPSYHHHLRDILIDLFTPLQTDLENIVGCTIQDAFILIEGMEAIMAHRLGERRAEARQSEKDIKAKVKRYRIKQNKGRGRKLEQVPEEEVMYQQWGCLRPSEAAEKIQGMVTTWLFYAIGDTISFTLQELADETQIEVGKVQTFLERLSLSFGEVDPKYYRFPAATHPLVTKPLVRHGEHYLRPVKDLSYWSLRPAIETLLNPDNAGAVNHNQTLWARYDKIRADYVEKKALEYLSNALHPDQAYQSLKYWITEHGEHKETELDGLIIIDSALLLVEAKAGSMTQPARRGAPKALMTGLRELVGKAYSQVLRAKKYIQQTDYPTFSLSDGSTVQVPKERINRIFMVSVTLDALDAFVTNISQFPDLGFFEEDDLPWAVSLTDLRVISELVEFPSQFIHYLTRRLRVNEHRRVMTHDELDWFGTYLHDGLYFEDMLDDKDAPDMVFLLSATTHFDDYYYFITGLRKTTVPKPTQPIPEAMHQMVTELETLRAQGYLEIACSLLDMSFTARQRFVDMFLQQRKRTLQDQQLHDFTFQFEHKDKYITCMFALDKHAADLEKRLANYCTLKKYQVKSDLWIGLACVVDRPRLIQSSIVLQNTWRYDAEMERQVASSFPITKG